MTDSAAEGRSDYLTFSLGGEEYAVPIRKVQEIREYAVPTRMVSANPHVLGVYNLRGVIIPVIDLRIRLGVAAGYNANTATVIMSVNGLLTGLVVDGVSDVVSLARDQILPVPDSLAGVRDGGAITGLATAGSRMLVLTDVDMLLGDQGCAVHLAA